MKKHLLFVSALLVLFASVSGFAQNTEQKKVEVNFLALSGTENALNGIIKGFETKYPQYSVKLELLPFDKLFQSLEVRLAAKDSSLDVFLVDAPVVANYTVKNYLEPLDSLVSTDTKAKITDSSLKASTFRGKLMVMPLNSSTVNLYYNKDIFAKRGVTPPPNDVNKRWTWEQVAEAAKKLTYTENGQKIYGMVFEQINRPYQLIPLGQSAGAKQLVSDDGLTSAGYTNSDAMVKGAQFYYDTYNTWKVSPKIAAEETANYFQSGKVAIFIGGPWDIPAFKTAKVNFGFAPHPYFKGGTPVTPTGSWMLGVSKYSEKKEAAAKFVQYTSAEEGAQINFDLGGNLPCSLAVLEKIKNDPKYQKFPDNSMQLAVFEAVNTAVSRPQTPGYTEWQSVMEESYANIMNGTAPKKALDDAVEEIDAQLKKYK
jgi:ABC-type glycerol-3-phosphate transport system substrate-binding protein